jgi:hypothetical protein
LVFDLGSAHATPLELHYGMLLGREIGKVPQM